MAVSADLEMLNCLEPVVVSCSEWHNEMEGRSVASL